MNSAPAACPICHNNMEITRLYCRSCDTALEGHFFPPSNPLQQLSNEHLAFLITFVRNEGKINRVCEDLGISYPTVRSRLHDLIRALGYEVGEDEEAAEEDRRAVLEALNQGTISSEEALKRLSSKA